MDHSAAQGVRRVDFLPWEYDPASAEGAAQAARQRELVDAGAQLGAGVFVAPNAAVYCDRLALGDRTYVAALAYLSGDLTIGADCSVNPFAVVRGEIRMGDGVRIGAHSSILGFNHQMANDRPVFQQDTWSKGITIGDDVWIGSNATILDGVTVGDHVVVAAGTYGTQTLLHRMKDTGLLPRIPARLGELTRTNSEALVGSQTTDRRYRKRHGKPRVDFTRGVAITSSIHPDENTHIEPVRYGKGSNAMGGMTILQVPYGAHRVRNWLLEIVKHPTLALRSLSNRRWSERTIIGLVMQSLDNSLTTYRKPGGIGKGLLTARQGHGAPNPDQIPEATRAAALLAEEINGFAGSNIGELMGTPLTAHFLGGCPIGADAQSGVIDPYHRLYGHPGISVVDGAAVSANLGVNPSLTITAQAERAMSFWPNKGEDDPRPAQHEAYIRLAAVEPKSPAVPADAFGALKLPFLGMPTVPPKKS